MHQAIRAYVRVVDRVNRFVGRCAMYLIFVMLGVLLYSSLSKAVFTPAIWTLETAQFLMVAYFLLGGAYAMQLGDHVRMDLLYGRWQPRTRAWVDAVTILFLLFYLVVLLYGGLSSTHYAFEYDETSYSAWSPYMAPIKIIMCFGIALMLLQAITIRDQRYEQACKSVDFIQRYIFPGGALPSMHKMLDVITRHTDFNLHHMEDFGLHYARTLRLWHDNLRQARHRLEQIGYDDYFYRLWEFYLCYCEGGFLERAIGTAQLLLGKPGTRRKPLYVG